VLSKQIFMLQKVEVSFNFLKQEILLREEVAICTKSNLTLQCNVVAPHVALKGCSNQLALHETVTRITWSSTEI